MSQDDIAIFTVMNELNENSLKPIIQKRYFSLSKSLSFSLCLGWNLSVESPLHFSNAQRNISLKADFVETENC
jgi:hypothetical protein